MKVTYKDISSYRKEIMGIAIIFIMISHNSLDLPGILHSANGALKMLTQVGVDLFFFLSGYGCYYSMSKDSNPLSFYKKRIVRIMPAYIIAVALFGLYFVGVVGEAISDYAWKYSLVSFYKDGLLHEWFIAAIMVVYILFPLVYYIMQKVDVVIVSLLVVLYVIIAAFSMGYISLHGNVATVFGIFITRIPAFIIGAFFAKNTIKGKELNQILPKVLSFIGIVLCGYYLYIYHIEKFHYWTIIRTLFIFTLLAIIFIWVTIRNTLGDRVAPIKKIASFMGNVGGYTLEIYLIHEKCLSLITNYAFRFIHMSSCIVLLIANVLAFVVSIVAAKYLNLLVNKIVGK